MAFHIVTNRCFLVCEKVISVVLEELSAGTLKAAKKSKDKTKKEIGKAKAALAEAPFCIAISYYPLAVSQQSSGFGGNSQNGGENTLEIRVNGKVEAAALFREIVKEVQEQQPDEAYLDKLVNNLLEDDFNEVEFDDKND